MSQDLLLGNTDRNWSRDPSGTDDKPSGKSPLTEKEKDRIEKLAQLEMLASRGDKTAQKKMIEINAALGVLQKRASKGDPKSKRVLETLQDSGLLVLSESNKGQRLVMAGAFGRTRRPRQQATSAQLPAVNPAEQVQEFLVNLKMRTMAGDPQAAAVLQQYQQILLTPPEGLPPPGMQPQMPPGEGMIPPEGYPQGTPMAAPEGYPPQGPPPGYPQGYPPGAPMAGDDTDNDLQILNLTRRQRIQLLKSRATVGDEKAIAALQILQARRAQRHARQATSNQSSTGYNSHWAYIRGLDKSSSGHNGHWAFMKGIGEEEIALAREGGACERAALKRR
jgi:hypothetical protein